MGPSAEWPEEVEGLRLVRSFLALPAEKRQLVLQFVEELASRPGISETPESERPVP